MTTTCAERINEQLEDRLVDLRKLWGMYLEDCEKYDEDLGNMDEYGLCFDYVAPETFNDQTEGYFRYQLSTGGPGDEFRIYASQSDEYSWSVYRIEYWFLDWFDGAHRTLSGDNLDFIKDIFEVYFVQCGTASHVYKMALELT
jgi:hypothetical protein